MKKVDEQAQDLFDLLVQAPGPVRRDDLLAGLGIIQPGQVPSRAHIDCFHDVKGALQDLLGAGDSITVIGDPNGGNAGGWLYSLQGDPKDPTAVIYLVTKTKGIYLRQRRQYMVVRALADSIPGNTTAGKYARRLLRSQFRALEDTVDVLVELGVGAPPMPLPPRP